MRVRERSELLTQEEIEEWMESLFRNIDQSVAITNVEITEFSEPDLPFKVSFDVAIENYAEYRWEATVHSTSSMFRKMRNQCLKKMNRIDTIFFPYTLERTDMINLTTSRGLS
jgi:hypothetical protein